MPSSARKRCAIVGAAVSGLPSARWALAYGFEPVIFERLDQLGGLWRYKPQQFEADLASVMKFTVIDTSKEMNAFSDFPPPDHFANYMHNTQMVEYLELYAKHHGLDQHIRYRNTVLSVSRAPDFESNGGWIVRWRDAEGQDQEEQFECVLLAQGHHAKPKEAQFPGQELFQGRIIHSHDYKDSRVFEDKVNVVVGAGNSAMDLAVELGRVGKKCFLSTRRGAWVGKRVGPGGIPEDYATSRFNCCVWNRLVPEPVRNWLLINQLQKRFDHAKYGIMPKHSYFSQHLTISDDLPTRIITGAVACKPDIREFTASGIVWMDGTRTEPVDNVVLATGYLFDFSLVEGGQLMPVHDNQARLYKNMLPPELAQWNSLAVIGLLQPSGSILPSAEMQARLFFASLSGQTKLPSREEMEREIDSHLAKLAEQFVKSTRHTLEVDFVPYLDSLASLLGCQPRPLELALSDPRLAYALLFGPNVSYVYRLWGPHPWAGARDAILGVWKRTEGCLSGRKPPPDGEEKNEKMVSQQQMMFTALLGAFLLLFLFVRLFIF